MQIRIQSTGEVMYEAEFRAYTKANGGTYIYLAIA
jgi:hypothetical protein